MKDRVIQWHVVAFLLGYPLLFLGLLPYYLSSHGAPSAGLIAALIVIVLGCGLSITAGYHRYYSHKTYQLNPLMELIMLGFGTLAVASTALKWSHDHRLHHKHVDTDKDPYNIKEGFWHAHILWIFFKNNTWEESIVKDLFKNKMVVFQERYYTPLVFGLNIAQILLVGWLTNDYLGAFMFTFLLRMLIIHHSMYSINSLAHYYGSQPYSSEHTAVNNWLISLVSFGEGYHNFHHTFPYDYRNGVRWYQFDPSKVVIWTLSKLGLASNLKKTSDVKIAKALIREDEKRILQKIHMNQQIEPSKRNLMAEEIQKMAHELNERLEKIYQSTKLNVSSYNQKNPEKDETYRQCLAEWYKVCNQYLVTGK